jgi:hypothetical protein
MTQISAFDLVFSWAGALGAASAWGVVVGLWRLRRALVGGRARGLATAALGLKIGVLVLAAAWQLIWSHVVVAGHDYDAMRTLVTVAGLTLVALGLAASGLWLAAVMTVVRGPRWAVRALVAGLALLGEEAWRTFGYAYLLEHTALDLAVGIVASIAVAAALLGVLLPARRSWRATLAGPAPGLEGPYREPGVPAEPWRAANELRIAGAGIVEVRRWYRAIFVLALVSVPVGIIFGLTGPQPLPYVATVLGVVHVVLSFRLARGLAGYTRAPYELSGRALGVGALLCSAGGLAVSAQSLIGLPFALTGETIRATITIGQCLGGALVGSIGTLLLVVSLGRAARALQAAETARRARAVLLAYGALVVLATLGILSSAWPVALLLVAIGAIAVVVAMLQLLDEAVLMLPTDH